MIELLKNPWLVGMGASVLGGLLVTFFTRLIFSRRENREYLRRVVQANTEVLYAIRPSLPDDHVPSQEVIEALIVSIARKHAVDSDYMYSPAEVAEDLIREVMDSDFISPKAKLEYVARLQPMRIVDGAIVSNPVGAGVISDVRRRAVGVTST